MKNIRLLSRLYFRQVWQEVPFLIITACGLGLIVAFILMTRGAYEAQLLPYTYDITDIFRRFQPGLWAILLLFGGELNAKEKNAGISPLLDVLPYATGTRLSAQIWAMHLTALSLLILMLITGLATQAFSGFYQFNLPLYFQVLFVEILGNTSFMILLGFFIHTIVNQRFAGHIIIITLILIRSYLPAWGLEHPLFQYGGLSFGRYSDLTDFTQANVTRFWYYLAYWLGLGLLLFGLSRLSVVRGIETGLKARLTIMVKRFSKLAILMVSVGLILFIGTGSIIYVHTNLKNDFTTIKEERACRAAYEKTLKAYESLPAPQITAVTLSADLYPEQDAYQLNGSYTLKNPWQEPITQVFVQSNLSPKLKLDPVQFSVSARETQSFDRFKAALYELDTPLLPGDSLQMHFRVDYQNTALAHKRREYLPQTASFFTNDHLPKLGYHKGNELQGPSRRARHGLAMRERELAQNDPKGYAMGINQAHSINFEATISAPEGYFATTSGILENTWQEGNRQFFHYASQAPIENQFMILAGQWNVKEEKVVHGFGSVQLRLRHHPKHERNTAIMQDAMRQSLIYYSRQFSPYQYDQLNLVEVSRAHDFAMSVPNTIAYSEALGFINAPADSVIPYFITAHEVAHQWWGDQVRAALVKGESMIVETLAQYSAGSVTLKHLGEAAFERVLLYERGRYLRRRKQEVQQEQPLVLAEDQAYIHYGKGLLNMMALRHYISEDSLNSALRRFIKAYPASENKYPNSHDLISEIRMVTPDSLQYLVTDLFEKITFWDARIDEATIQPINSDQYELQAQMVLKKLAADQEGLLEGVDLADWIEIAVYGLNGQGKEIVLYQKMHRFNQPEQSLTLQFESRPIRIEIDPKHLLMDRNIDDNARQL